MSISRVKPGCYMCAESLCDECGAICPQCARKFDPILEGKVRRAEHFCSLRCADEAHPDMAQGTRS